MKILEGFIAENLIAFALDLLPSTVVSPRFTMFFSSWAVHGSGTFSFSTWIWRFSPLWKPDCRLYMCFAGKKNLMLKGSVWVCETNFLPAEAGVI